MTHRIGAGVVFVAIALLAWRLWRSSAPQGRRWARLLMAVAVWQFATGLSNVVLGWPLAAAVAHTAGAAALAVLLTVMLARTSAARRGRGARGPADVSARAAS